MVRLPRVGPLLRAVATSHVSHAGWGPAPTDAASATSAPTPEALSSAPGAGGTESVWAMSTRRQSERPSRMPSTLCDVALPGTVNVSWPMRSPAARNRSSTRACARASAADAAGRGPASASERAKA